MEDKERKRRKEKEKVEGWTQKCFEVREKKEK